MRKIYNYIILAAVALFALCSCQVEESPITGSDAAILSCTVSSNGISFDAGISENQITVNLPQNSDLSQLNVEFTISEGAVVTPLPEEVSDWSDPVSFNVVSANKENERNYTVIITVDTDKIFDSSVRIGNNAALEKFGENGYTVVGDLLIYDDQSGDPIENLEALNAIKEIKTDLEIRTDNIVSAKMESLRSVGNVDILSLSIEEVSFPALEYVSGRFRIGNDDVGPMPKENETLKTVELNSLQSVGKSFVIFLCVELEDIYLPELKHVGEDFKIVGGTFKDLSMIKNLTEIGGIAYLGGHALSSLEGFNLKKIGGSLLLKMDNVTSLEPLSVLKSVPYINIQGSENSTLSSFKGMENIDVDALDIAFFPLITTTEYLPLKNKMLHISLKALPNLTSLDGFEKISEIGNLYFLGLVSIKDMHQLSNLSHADNLMFQFLESLEDLPDMSKLTKVEKKITISKMRVLKNLKGLSSLKEVGSLMIDNLLAAESLEGLENLEKITEGGMTIGACPFIKNLAPLAKLKEVNMPNQMDRIYITFNDILEDYTAVRDILVKYWKSGGGKFPKVQITNNKYNPTYQQLLDGQCTPPEE